MRSLSIQDAVYTALRNARGAYLSGQTLSDSLHVSRNAVWKAVVALRQEGFEIEAATRLGYRLAADPGRLSAADIRTALRHKALIPEVYEMLPSTNTELKKRAALGAPDGLILAARRQSAGRGRYGRSFYSPADSGVYFSILLRPNLSLSQLRRVTPAAAVAAAQTLEPLCAQQLQIKWVNDIYIAGRKAAGILTELATDLESGGSQTLICGFGINLYPPIEGFPEALQQSAGCIFDDKPCGELRCGIIAGICDHFLDALALPEQELLAQYRQRSLLDGRKIRIQNGSRQFFAQALGIADDFSLYIRREDGTETSIQAGEAHILPI